MLNLIVFSLSIIGMFLSLHVWILQQRGFDQGCWGLAKPDHHKIDSPCHEAQRHAAGVRLLGFPAVLWAFLFYFTFASLSFAKVIVVRFGFSIHLIQGALLICGASYIAYLLYYQVKVIKTACPPCLALAVLFFLIGIIHLTSRGHIAGEGESAKPDLLLLGLHGLAAFIGFSLLMGWILFFNRLGLRSLAHGESRRQIESVLETGLNRYIDPKKLAEMRPCRFDDEPLIPKARVLVGDWLPNLGAKSPLEIVEFFDPNCPACKRFNVDWSALFEQYHDELAFFRVPTLLWEESRLQTQALFLAAQKDKYLEMIHLQYGHRKPGGLQLRDLQEMFDLLDIAFDDLDRELSACNPKLITLKRNLRRFGIHASPLLFINGRKVYSGNRSLECLNSLILRQQKTLLKSGPA